MQFLLSTPYNCTQLAKSELKRLGYPLSTVKSPTTIEFTGDIDAIATINLRSRVANKLYIIAGVCQCYTWDQLYEGIKGARREHRVTPGQQIIIQANSKKSILTSEPTIQSITQKAIYDKISPHGQRQIDDSITPLEITISIENNEATICLNTTGDSLHRRGYRTQTGTAPIKENITASLILDAGWKFSLPLYDICCGSGTIAIEAGLIAKNIAPGLSRNFTSEKRNRLPQNLFDDCRTKAKEQQVRDKSHTIIGSDSDPKMIIIAQQNAINAGLEDSIQFEVRQCQTYIDQYIEGTIVSNPPYGDRLNPQDIHETYQTFNHLFSHNSINGGVITGYERHPTGLRKTTNLYNGADPVIRWKKKD